MAAERMSHESWKTPSRNAVAEAVHGHAGEQRDRLQTRPNIIRPTRFGLTANEDPSLSTRLGKIQAAPQIQVTPDRR